MDARPPQAPYRAGPRRFNRRSAFLSLCAAALLVSGAAQAGGPSGILSPLPRLFVLSIGVGEHKKPGLTLRYPAEDAREVATLFREQRGGMYSDVEVHVLTDGEARKERILDELEWLARQTAAQDLAILFLAGHGLTDPLSGQYYYLPSDADPDAVWRSMLPASELRTALRAIAGRALVFIDTCHAGAAFAEDNKRGGSANPRELASALSQPERGIVVIAAASQRQAAVEKKELRHGAFTAALLDGLTRDALADRAGRVTVAALELYLDRRVRRLTGGVQAPSVAKLTPVQDFPIYLRMKFGAHDVPLFR